MISLSSIFKAANKQSVKQRDVLVLVEDETLYGLKDTQVDWAANSSESNIDYTPSPPSGGEVVLAGDDLIVNLESGGDAWSQDASIFNYGQTFKPDASVDFYKCSFYLRNTHPTNTWSTTVTLLSGNPETGTLLATSATVVIPANMAAQWVDYDFSNTAVTGGQLHSLSLSIGSGDTYLGVYRDSNNGYPDGTYWHYVSGAPNWTEQTTWDHYFRAYFLYPTTGSITTNNIDIGEVPTVEGEWAISDTKPTGTTLTYTAEYSTTGLWTGEEVPIGTITDGLAITVLARYWRVTATLTANTARDETPTLQSIKADYTTYRRFNKIPDLGYEPIVTAVSSLTSKVDFFKPASIGQISVAIQMTDVISDWVYTETLYNKIVQVKLGFKYDGFTQADYIHYFTGAIDDWTVTDGILNLTLKDLSKEWKLPVPSKWESVADDVTWTNIHHTDVMLDIFQNDINVRDSGLLLDYFATVKAATPAYKVTRTITGSPIDAKKLVEELRVLLFAFFLPRGDGKIGIKQFDSAEAIVATFTDDNTLSIKWKANSKDLINRTSLYFDWDGDGEKEIDFLEYDPGDTVLSQTKFQEIRPFILKDKWTDVLEASQISDLETKILAQFDDMPSSVTITCDAKDIAYEAGDQMNVTTTEAPGSGGAGITDEKYLIVSKNLDFLGDKIVFEGLKVAV